MKTHHCGAITLLLFPGMAAMLSAQNFENPPATEVSARFAGKTPATLTEGLPVYLAQDSLTLGGLQGTPREAESTPDFGILREPSVYRKNFVAGRWRSTDSPSGDLKSGLELISATYREMGRRSSCRDVALSIAQHIRQDPSRTLEIVSAESTANPGCACEIVKAAIRSSEADSSLATAIAEAAITAAPETMRLVSQCVIAEIPEALPAVQALLARLDPNSGEGGTSAKSAKSAKSAAIVDAARSVSDKPAPNPLDLPPIYPIPPPPILPPVVTQVDP